MKRKEVFIVSGARTPIGNIGGALSGIRPDDMAAIVIRAALERSGNPDEHLIDDVILGCANQAGEDNRNIARMAGIIAGLPYRVPGETVNRLCASGMSAVVNAARAIRSGDAEMVIAGGVESMTRAPYVMSKVSEAFGRDAKMFDTSFGWRFINPALQARCGTDSMGETAENLLDMNAIPREEQDAFAYGSQQKASKARESGRFALEITEVSIPQRKGDALVVSQDEFIKPSTTLEGLSKLNPAFRKGGSVTAGNASGLNDGAAALIVASEFAVHSQQLNPMSRLVSSAVTGVEPRIMGIGPVSASLLALERAGLTLADMDILEFNEAFAAQILSCTRALGLQDNDPRINPNGGAIALGHPLGMTGTRMILTASHELRLQKKRFALCAMCIGVGQGYAVVLENVNVSI
jgi:acetyl-CoA acyltransferase